MSRRCSHCGHNGHNSRTCLDMKGGFKLFGVRLSTETFSPTPAESSCSSSSTAMRKSFSMGNLSNYGSPECGASPPFASRTEQPEAGDTVEGYASDDLVHASSDSRERKKGIPWTEEEHRSFLIGLQKLGKGDWRGISRNFVKTRTPTQVASHAQKYFLRQNNMTKRRRRSSLFDITPDTVSSLLGETPQEEIGCTEADVCAELTLGQSILYGHSGAIEASCFSSYTQPISGYARPMQMRPLTSATMTIPESMAENSEVVQTNELEPDGMEETTIDDNVPLPASEDAMDAVPGVPDVEERISQVGVLFPLPMWPSHPHHTSIMNQDFWRRDSKLVRPTPIIPRPPSKADETMKLPELSIIATRPVMEPTSLSYKLLEEGSRQSAFHMTSTPSHGDKEIDGQGGLDIAISVP